MVSTAEDHDNTGWLKDKLIPHSDVHICQKRK